MISMKTQRLLERFLSKSVPMNGCWIWSGFRDNKGYGRIRVDNGHSDRAHRVSYRLFNGSIPMGSVIRHRCDNPSCVDYSHLEIGNHQDNVKDRDVRGRTAFGSKIRKTKLTETQVKEIRSLWLSKTMTQNNIAKQFNITLPYAWLVATNRRRSRVK